jgi:hypothetical protein
MNCYECARNGTEKAAVAICLSCGVAMCLEHLDRERATAGPGGTQVGCSHDGGVRAAAPTRA